MHPHSSTASAALTFPSDSLRLCLFRLLCPSLIVLCTGLKKFWTTEKDEKNKYASPFTFEVGKRRVIEGWDIALSSMTIGEKSRFTISGNFGYGVEGFNEYGIGPYATLVYDILLLKIE
jgi:hypothetical protein